MPLSPLPRPPTPLIRLSPLDIRGGVVSPPTFVDRVVHGPRLQLQHPYLRVTFVRLPLCSPLPAPHPPPRGLAPAFYVFRQRREIGRGSEIERANERESERARREGGENGMERKRQHKRERKREREDS